MAESAFQKGWWGTDLPGARGCDGTYCYYPYETLPPLDESLFRGDFQWLTDLDDDVEAVMAVHRDPHEDDDLEMADEVNVLRDEAAKLKLVLPEEFIRFMSSAALQQAIPSCTACEFDLGELVPSVVEEGAHTLLFLRDQQDVLLWYLYLTPDGQSSVICSPIPFDDEDVDEPVHVIKANTLEVAPNFEAFLYRFWIENTIWFALDDSKPFTPAQKAYVDHYL